MTKLFKSLSEASLILFEPLDVVRDRVGSASNPVDRA